MIAAERFDPMHAAHAIEFVHFGLQFGRQLSDPALKKLVDRAKSLSDKLPGRHEIRGVSIAVGPTGPASLGTISGAMDGLILNKVAPNGAVVQELRVDRSGIAYRDGSYSRWQQVHEGFLSIVVPLLSVIDGEEAIYLAQLQYMDRMNWNGSANTCRAAGVMRQGSRYLSPCIFDAEDLWHSHTGQFVKADDEVRRLVQVNVDCLSEQEEDVEKRFIRVSTTVTDLLNQPGYKPNEVGFARDLSDRLNGLHDLLKSIFKELVTDEFSSKIGLNQ